MRRFRAASEKPLHWVGSSKRDLLAFPERAIGEFGWALEAAQFGGRHPAAKPWMGLGPRVLEIVEDFDGNAFRRSRRQDSRLQGWISDSCTSGLQPRKPTTRRAMAKSRSKRIPIEVGSGNVFVDLGFPDAEERTTKVALAVEILRILKERGLTQAAAAELLGVNQPKVSALANYRLDGFSVERLMTFLTALGRDVDITIRPSRSVRTPGRIQVAAAR